MSVKVSQYIMQMYQDSQLDLWCIGWEDPFIVCVLHSKIPLKFPFSFGSLYSHWYSVYSSVSNLQVKCSWWTGSSTAHSLHLASRWSPSLNATKRIASIPWSTFSLGWPSAPSTNLARPGTLKNTTHFVFCRSTLSTRRSTSSSGSGYFSSVSKPLYLPHLLFKKQRKPLRKLLLPFLSTFFPLLWTEQRKPKVKRNLITEHDTSAFPKLKMNDLVSFPGLLSFLVLVYRVVIIFSPYIRAFVLRLRYRRVKRECIEMVIGKSYVGDWFLIYLMGQNIDSVIFKVSSIK